MSCSLLCLHLLRTSGLNRRQDVSQCLLKEDMYIGKNRPYSPLRRYTKLEKYISDSDIRNWYASKRVQISFLRKRHGKIEEYR